MRNRASRAFTLVELLVAAGITVLIAGLGLAVTSRLATAWSRAVGDHEARATARVAIEEITHDLQSALYRDDGAVWFRATVSDDTSYSGLWEEALTQKPAGTTGGSLRLNAAELTDCRFGRAGVVLAFFTQARSETDNSTAPTAVGYQIIRRQTGIGRSAAGAKYVLCRSVVRPAQVEARLGALEAGFDLDPTDTANAYIHSGAANDGTAAGDPYSIRHPAALATVLAENVIDLGVRLHGFGDTGELEEIFPASGREMEYLARAPSADGTEAGAGMPCVADVMLRVLTGEGARMVAAMEAPSGSSLVRPAEYRTDAEWWWGVVEANSRVYVRRIMLSASLP